MGLPDGVRLRIRSGVEAALPKVVQFDVGYAHPQCPPALSKAVGTASLQAPLTNSELYDVLGPKEEESATITFRRQAVEGAIDAQNANRVATARTGSINIRYPRLAEEHSGAARVEMMPWGTDLRL
jgi:hypothetical protein